MAEKSEYINTKFVLLNKNGNVTNKKFPNNGGELSEILNKKTRLKMSCLPMKLYTYYMDDFRLDIWGYIDGKAGQENTHDLPPNADNHIDNFNKSDTDLLFGDLFVLKYNNVEPDKLDNIDINEYAVYYTKLFGGFEDIHSDSEISEDPEPTQEDIDFIVDDNSELSYDGSWNAEESEESEKSDSDIDNE